MIRALIIDDEPLAVSVVREYLKNYREIEAVMECGDGFEGARAIQQHKPDLIFLDIQMPKINGFEMLELIDNPPAVIFTTAFDEFAIRAFEQHAVDYLLKPFSKDRFDQAIRKYLEKQPSEESAALTRELLHDVAAQTSDHARIVVKSGSNIRIIPVREVIFIEAYDDYVKIHTADDVYLKKKTMAFYEKTLDPSMFVRVHRSFIVQVQQITRIEHTGKESHNAVLKNGQKIPMSKTGYPRLREILGV